MRSVFGYSVTAPLRRHEGHPDIGPRSMVLDQRHQVTISRLGSRVRVSGGGILCYACRRLETGGAAVEPVRYHLADGGVIAARRVVFCEAR